MGFKKGLVRGMFMLIALGLAGCMVRGGSSAGKTPEQKKQPSATNHIDKVPTSTQEVTDQKKTPTVEISAPEKTIQPTVKKATPTARRSLQASTPDHVQIASGEIQLVEFFAFW